MRRVFAVISLGLVAACATVAVVPGEAIVESGLSQTQSALRSVASAFCERAVEAGWVQASGGLAGMADTLISGKDNTAPTPADYAARIGARTQAPSLVLARIAADTDAARQGLMAVSLEARAVLGAKSANAADRTDVMSFERALVRAQMSHRNFVTALDQVAARDDFDADTDPVEDELEALESAIDAARRTADGLADRYAKIDDRTS
jgi:hypothetical protein